MRILMLNNEFPPLGGGTGTVNQTLLARFAAVPDLHVDLITSALGWRGQEERLAERVRLFKVPVVNRDIHHSSNRELLTYSALALPLALRLHQRQRYDLAFAWSAVPAGGVALALRRLVGLPYLVRVCGPDIPGFEARYRRLYTVLTPVIKAIWHGAEKVVAKCQEEADMVKKVDAQVAVTLVPNGVDIERFRPATPPGAGEPLRLICVGRLIERKGQNQLIRAVKRLCEEGIDVTLDLVGTGDARHSYEALAHDLGVQERVHFRGYVPREQIADHYAAAHVFVLASQNEGMSVATLEAMAAGLPLVVTRTGGTKELVAVGFNGFTFDWGDVDALCAHLRQLARNHQLTTRVGSASRECATSFSWQTVAPHYLTMFAEMIGKTALLAIASPAEGDQC